MKHFSSEEGVDFVNGTLKPERREEMQKHLDSGCRRCSQAVELWQRVRRGVAAEPAFQPPADLLRIANAAFGTRDVDSAPCGFELLFDSLLQPAMAGVRSISANSSTRQLLYGVGDYLLDLYIAPKSAGKSIGVTGQLLSAKNPELILKAVPIVVSNRKGTSVVAVTNHFGEFQAEVDNAGDLELRLPTSEGKDITIPLGCLMVNLTGIAPEKAAGTRER